MANSARIVIPKRPAKTNIPPAKTGRGTLMGTPTLKKGNKTRRSSGRRK